MATQVHINYFFHINLLTKNDNSGNQEFSEIFCLWNFTYSTMFYQPYGVANIADKRHSDKHRQFCFATKFCNIDATSTNFYIKLQWSKQKWYPYFHAARPKTLNNIPRPFHDFQELATRQASARSEVWTTRNLWLSRNFQTMGNAFHKCFSTEQSHPAPLPK